MGRTVHVYVACVCLSFGEGLFVTYGSSSALNAKHSKLYETNELTIKLFRNLSLSLNVNLYAYSSFYSKKKG